MNTERPNQEHVLMDDTGHTSINLHNVHIEKEQIESQLPPFIFPSSVDIQHDPLQAAIAVPGCPS